MGAAGCDGRRSGMRTLRAHGRRRRGLPQRAAGGASTHRSRSGAGLDYDGATARRPIGAAPVRRRSPGDHATACAAAPSRRARKRKRPPLRAAVVR